VLDELHDYARIYLNGEQVGTLDRRLGQNHLDLDVKAAGSRLDILVENTGRVNFTTVIRGERKGITKQVMLAGKPLTGWQIYPLPMNEPGEDALQDGRLHGSLFLSGNSESGSARRHVS
jgi:beta-galactosidase